MQKINNFEEKLEKVRILVRGSLKKMAENVSLISLRNLEEGTINPYLVKGLGLSSIDEAVEFYVWQRVGRSVTTSFGSVFENTIKILTGAKKGNWWDLVTDSNEYMSIKSGPRDMDKDQVVHFSNEAKKIMKQNPNAKTFIVMAYGKIPFSIMAKTLKDEGLNPDETLVVGLKSAFKKLVNNPSLADDVIKILEQESKNVFGNGDLIKLVNSKIKELTDEGNKKYKNLNNLIEELTSAG